MALHDSQILLVSTQGNIHVCWRNISSIVVPNIGEGKYHISFALLDFRNIMRSMLEGTMSTPFYDPFLTKFIECTCPRMKEPNVWLWIVGDKKAEQLYSKWSRKCNRSTLYHYKKTRSESTENQLFCVGFYIFEKIKLKCINFASLSNRVNIFMLLSADLIMFHV